jgi:hypothetical protein
MGLTRVGRDGVDGIEPPRLRRAPAPGPEREEPKASRVALPRLAMHTGGFERATVTGWQQSAGNAAVSAYSRWAERDERGTTALRGLLGPVAPGVVGAEAAGPEQVEPLGKQVLQLGDRAALAQHVPVRTRGLLLLELRLLTVGAQ